MKHVSYCHAAAVLSIAFFCLSCSGDRPTETVPQTDAGRAQPAVGTVQDCVASASVTTAAQFKDALNNICDDGIINIAANDTIHFYYSDPASQNVPDKSFTIQGVDATSVLHVHSMASNQPLIQGTDSDHTHEVTIQNLTIIREDGGTGLILLNGFDRVEILDVVVMVLGSQPVSLTARTILVDGLDLRTEHESGLGINTNDDLGEFSHTIQNSRIEYTSNASHDAPVHSTLTSNDGGTITWNDNNIIAAQAENWWQIYGVLDAGVQVQMNDNDFGLRNIEVINSGSGQIAFDLNCNNSNRESCPGVVEHESNLVTVSDADTPTWTLGYGACNALGAATNQQACVYEGIAYVKFSVHHPLGFEPSMTVFARWSDDDCTTGYTDEPATYNSSTNKWVASFDASGIVDGSFYWKGMATLCSTTGSGTCQARSMHECGGGGYEPFISE